jgi:TatD DNase family protein
VLVDSHCHIDFPELATDIDAVVARMHGSGVLHALCVSVNLEDFPRVVGIADRYNGVYASVGVHPDHEGGEEPTSDRLCELATAHKVVAIGETGLDYFRQRGDVEWQRERFRTHIRASRACGKPLIIHTRSAAEDTIRIMGEEGADAIGGVMHCFTESWEVAEQALALNFHISFSGIVTFKNAMQVKEVACRVPLERMLIETDSPYLAPMPFRGKRNEPSYVRFVAEEIAKLRAIPVQELAERTSANFLRLFRIPQNCA